MSGAVAPEQPGFEAPTRAGGHLFELVRRTLERPLASYQLILGTSGLLLHAFKEDGSEAAPGE